MIKQAVSDWLTYCFFVGILCLGCKGDNGVSSEHESDELGSDSATGGVEEDTSEEDSDDGEKAKPRGTIENFPEDCTKSCQEACDNINDCGGSEHPEFPLDYKQCGYRCLVGQGGSMWDDVTENFRCCASQEKCGDVASCGGWLSHPDTESACDLLCGCLFGTGASIAKWAGVSAPKGYRFAADVIAVEQSDHSADYRGALGSEVISNGRYQFIQLPWELTAAALKSLEHRENIVPTFRDPSGRLSAAPGGLIARVLADDGARRLVRFIKDHDLPPPRALHYDSSLFYISADDGWHSLTLLAEIENLAGVSAEIDMLHLYEHTGDVNDDRFPSQWHLENTGQDGRTVAGVDSRVTEAWDLTMGDSDVVIGILDNGVDLNHADLKENLVAYDSPADFNYPDDWEAYLEDGFANHGTPCAGVAVAQANNGEGGAGVCPNCSLMPMLLAGQAGINLGLGFQVTDQEVADLIVKMVDQGAWIISNSWGFQGEDPLVESPGFPAMSLSQTLASAFAYAETDGRGGKGTLVLFSSGNSNQNVSMDRYLAVPTVIGVGAVDDQGLKSYFSSFGTTIDIVTPSAGGLASGIDSTMSGPDTTAKPQYTTEFGGTSSAVPFAAGIAGLVLSANKDLTAKEVRSILTESATKIDPVWGQWDESGFSAAYGYGLANSYVAVRMALSRSACLDLESCLAPSDASCFEECVRLGSCLSCRVDSNCPGDAVCQALPSLGHQICVSKVGRDGCKQGYGESRGYCIPDRKTCNLCRDKETCNGRDDDCDGQIDEIEECDGMGPRCLQSGEGCKEGQNCAATFCGRGCQTDEDCAAGTCIPTKDRYGKIDRSNKICYTGNGLYCQMACQTLASSLEEKELQEFVSCIEDDEYCADVMGCAEVVLGPQSL